MQGIPFSKYARGHQILCKTLSKSTLSRLQSGGNVRHLTKTSIDCCGLKSGINPLRLNSLLSLNPTGKPPSRHFCYGGIPQEFCGKKTLEQFHRKDGIPKSYTLIYRTNFPNYLMFSQIVVFLAFGATITTALLYLVTDQLTEEELDALKKKEEEIKLSKESSIERHISDFKKDHGLKTDPFKPELQDFFDKGSGQILVMASALLTLVIGLFRIQRFLPVRIYTNKKNHCIAVMYGHLLPGKLTWHEFVSGTIVPSTTRMKFDFFQHSLFQDGSGKNIILMDQFFRTPADFNRLQGFQEENDEHMTEEQVARRQRRM